jgi:CBS domain-containing protein
MATVRDILGRGDRAVATIGRGRTVLEAAHLMNDRRIGALVVTEKGVVVGIFTERDILTRIVAEKRDPSTTLVGDAMTAPVCYCEPEATLEDCRQVITTRRIRHLPVVVSGRLVGIVTSGDILAHEAFEREHTLTSLFEYIHGPAVRVATVSAPPPQS